MSAGTSQIPKGLHHLESIHRSKFTGKWPSRLPHPPTKWVSPTDRIRKWNIRPDDRVRLLVGKPREKFLNEEEGALGGYKIYRVTSIDMERNRIYLEGMSAKRSATTSPRPSGWGDMSVEDKQKWDQENQITPAPRAVHYSNVQLCVEEDGPKSIFASRIATDQTSFNSSSRRLVWNRFAAKLSGPSYRALDAEKGLVQIPWPKSTPIKKPPASALDTPSISTTLSLTPSIPSSVPSSPTAKIEDQTTSNTYTSSIDPSSTVDTLMPMYLSEELSPRYSRAKRTQSWNVSEETRLFNREKYATEAVDAWERAGRDKVLNEVLTEVGLEGIKIRGRTRKEVREAAYAEFDEKIEQEKKVARAARREDKLFDGYKTPEGEWIGEWKPREMIEAEKNGVPYIPKPSISRKEKREARLEKRMRNMTLAPLKNTVIPDSLRS